MERTDWTKMVSERALSTEKSLRKKIFVSMKIAASDLPAMIDQGWEKSKEYKSPKFVGITKEKPANEQFEDLVWLLFANMGFSEMNAGSPFEVSYDFHDDSLKYPVSVVAVDDETILVVVCQATDEVTERSFADEIQEFSSKISGIRKEILKQYPGRKTKFIWATHNYITNRRDLALLDKAGIAYFNDSAIEYYSELAKHLGSCSRYQLLGNLFANQEIKNMDDRVPAIQGKMGGYTYYSFSIEPEKLLKIGYVLHRSEANQNMMPTYQRIIKKKRLQDVRAFINDGGYFPNSIIISIDSNGKGLAFDQSSTKIDGTISKIGILHIPKRYRSAYIIDGQHRLYGYSDSKYAATNTIPVVAFVDLERTEQIKLFMDINENQKAVPKSLRVTLNADMLWESPDFSEQRQALRSKIAQMLGEEPTSPLHGRVVIGENESTPERCITVEAIQSALKKCRFFDTYGKKNALQKSGTFDCQNNQETCDLFYPFIEKCLLYIREACLDEWNKGDRDSGMLTMNRGIQGVIRVIDDIVNMLVDKAMISPKSQDLDDMFGLIRYYLKPLADYINNLTAEQRKDLRGYFGGGADTRFWRAYQKAVSDARPDFNPEGLEEYWQNETKVYNEETKSMLREIESKIKLIVSSRLEEYYGDSWLVKGLPKAIYTRAKGEADEARYEQISNDDEDVEIPIWDYVTLAECKPIILNGKNWSLLFEDSMVRPEEANMVGGKDPKTDWILRVNSIINKLAKDSYSVPVDEYSYVKSVHEWLMGILVF
ncbi:DGQHR domain-containing protein [Pseudoflavonifractor phocaeensis]|uniref:DGQHR domain-containing protein n=1 Tax=Pseudoflavonifractor phocaeensis TaxID=1870988 RepID=UPI001F38310E|nr:DGQHR domain-containing protein [Pseudoflavonifractor phocaeensis]MCF2662324.1 DGQHR domain-containing protein [Pseudoflavonifractor phocaeensis]